METPDRSAGPADGGSIPLEPSTLSKAYARSRGPASAAAGVVAAARAGVTGARALHHAAALVAGGAELGPRHRRRADRRSVGHRRRSRLGLLGLALGRTVGVAVALRVAVAGVPV